MIKLSFATIPETDISSSFSSVLDFIKDGVKFVFDTLDSIKFWGISLLDFILGVLLISIILPIVLNLLQGGLDISNGKYIEKRNVSRSEARYQRRLAESKKRR